LRRGLISEDEARKRLTGGHTSSIALDPAMISDIGETAVKTAGAIGSGVIKAGQSLVNMPDTTAAMEKAFPMPKQEPLPIYKPDTLPMQRVEAVSRGTAGMLMPGISGKGLMLGALSGGAGQTARETMPDSPNAPAVAELATLLLGIPAMSTPRDVKTIKAIVDELGTQRLTRMKAAQEEAASVLGTKTIASHFAPENTSLTALVKEIANSPEGAPLRETLRNEKTAMAREQAILPTEVTPQTNFPQADAKRAAEAVAFAKQQPFKELTNKVKPYYEAAKGEVVPQSTVDQIVKLLLNIPQDMALDKLGPVTKRVESFANRVKGAGDVIPGKPGTPPGKVLDANGNPLVPGTSGTPDITLPPSAAELDSISKSASTAAKIAESKYVTDPVTKEAGVAMTKVNEVIRELVKPHAPMLTKGKELYAQGAEKLAPYASGPLDQLFPKSAMKGRSPATFETSMSWLRNPRTTADDVRFVGEAVRKTNPDEFRMLVGQNVFDAATNSKTPQEFVKALIGEADTAVTKQGAFKESVAQAALAAGKNPQESKEAAEGALKLLETLRTVSKGHEDVAGNVLTDVGQLAGKNWTSKMLRVLNPIGLYVRAWAEAGPIENAFRRKVFKSLSNTLSTPEGIDRLIEISKFSLLEHQSKILWRGLVATEAQQD
jgi:hypothetical protein